MNNVLVKRADNDDLTQARARTYEEAATTPEGKAALSKPTQQEWLLRGAGGLGGGLLGWLIGRSLFKKRKSIQLLFGLLGATAGGAGTGYMLKHIPGVAGSNMSYSDVTRLRNGVPGLVDKVVELENKGAGRPNTPAQAARKRWAESPRWYGNWTATGAGIGTGIGAYYGASTGNIAGAGLLSKLIRKGRVAEFIGPGNVSAKRLADLSRQAASSAAGKNGDTYQVLSKWLSGGAGKFESAAAGQGLDRAILRNMRDNGRLIAVKDPKTGLSHLARTNSKRRRAAAAGADAALFGLIGSGVGLGIDALTADRHAPGALLSGLSAAY